MENNVNNSAIAEKSEKSLAEIIESFFNGFRKLWWVMVIFLVLGGLFGYFYYRNTYVATYQTEATFSITAVDDGEEGFTSNSELAETLSVSFDYLINNEVFYEIIEEDIGLDYMPSTISVSVVKDSNILSIIVSGYDADLNFQVMNSVLDNYSDVAQLVLGDTQLTILEEPSVSDTPVNVYSPISSVLEFGLIGAIIGLIPSILYAFFVKTVKSKEEVEELLSVNCFGALPAVAKKGKDKSKEQCSILDKNVGFRYLESMRSISSRCEKEMNKRGCKVILVTSTVKGEGKSTFAMNLAYSLSKTHSKVMLIDGNLRKPSLRKMTGAECASYSMSDFTNKIIKSGEALVNIEGTRVILLAPDIPSRNPAECLNSENMATFIKECKEVVDYTIIDAPACDGLSDAAVLAKQCDGVVYIIKEDSTKVNKILDVLQEFSYTKKPIIGSVLNGTEGKLNIAYGYGYSRYGYNRYGYGRYGYGYGYGYGSKEYYGTYGEVTEKEFRKKSRSMSRRISLETTPEQLEMLEREKEEEMKNKS